MWYFENVAANKASRKNIGMICTGRVVVFGLTSVIYAEGVIWSTAVFSPPASIPYRGRWRKPLGDCSRSTDQEI